MDYESFKEELSEDLKQNLYERGVEDVEMSFHNIEKTNQSYEIGRGNVTGTVGRKSDG